MIVIADTTPIHYLVLIEQIEILPALYRKIVIPESVRDELLRTRTPSPVRTWMENSPAWLEIRRSKIADPELMRLDEGERDAIALAEDLGATLVILDDLKGRRAAESRGLAVVGTIGVLRDAAFVGLLDLNLALDRLSGTSFHLSPAVLNKLKGSA